MKALLYLFSTVFIKSDAIPVPDTLYVNSSHPTTKSLMIIVMIIDSDYLLLVLHELCVPFNNNLILTMAWGDTYDQYQSHFTDKETEH